MSFIILEGYYYTQYIPISEIIIKKHGNNFLKGINPPTYEYKIITKSGKEKWLNQRNSLIKDDRGNPIAIEGNVTDIKKKR